MAATVRASYYGGADVEPAGVTAETGIKFSREDTQVGTTPIPIPNAAGTNYSWYKLVALEVTGADTTSISNRTVRRTGAPAAGLKLSFKALAAYARPTGANKPADDAAVNDAIPAGYTEMTAVAQGYDAGSDVANAGRSGDFCQLIAGISNLYLGGAGNNQAVPSIELGYDES